VVQPFFQIVFLSENASNLLFLGFVFKNFDMLIKN
jgi:hypothetical protein